MEWLNALFRWIHVVAGVIWIGHLYFFNFVNGPFEKTLDGDSKKKVVPELRPRALYFFRWGAAYTWITGVLLLALVVYMSGGSAVEHWKLGVVMASWAVGFLVYDALWKSPLAKNVQSGAAISFALAAAYVLALRFGLGLDGNVLFIHLGSLFGTFMAANVWMRIWPNQRRIITAIRAGEAPNADQVALALLRSRHNTYMSVPLIFTMVAVHHPGLTLFMGDKGWLALLVVVALGWAAVWALYQKAASPVTAQV